MNLSKIFFIVFCFIVQLIAHEQGSSETSPSSRASTPDTVPHSSFVGRTLEGITSVAQTATLSLANLMTPQKSPSKGYRTHEDLDRLLGGKFLQKLFPHALPSDLQDFVLQHPDILTAVAVSAYAYLDDDLHKKNPDRPNEKTVHDYINSLGFSMEKLEDDLIVLTRTTADGIKQAWFSVTGTDSISDAITNIGIGAHMHARDYHDFMASVWSDHIAPKFYSEHGYCASALNYVSKIQMNLYHMLNMAYFTFFIHGFSIISFTEELYTTYSGILYSASLFMSAVLYWNMIPHALYKTRYKPHVNRLLARVRTRRKELGDAGYTDFFVTGHSSGGHGAQILGLLTGMRAFSFNAPGGALRHALWAYESTKDQSGLIKPTEADYKKSILAIVTKTDPVSALQHELDPVQPICVDLKGDHGFIGAHQILPFFWKVNKEPEVTYPLSLDYKKS